MTLDEFLKKVCTRPLPENRMAQVRTLAKELAEGVLEGQWDTTLELSQSPRRDSYEIYTETLKRYMNERWSTSPIEEDLHGEISPDELKRLFDLLITNNYLVEPEVTFGTLYKLLQKSFDLIDERGSASFFVSYRRSESSSFALLVLNLLKYAGQDAFLDMALEPGENWHASLEEKILSCDYFVLLLGKNTLASNNVCKEILWALEGNKVILPVWQPDFDRDNVDWSKVPKDIEQMINNTHAIRIQEESALEYHKAMTELLNRFGFTP